MDWSMKPLTRWDWENMMVCNGRVNETTQFSQPMNWSIESSNNGSVHSSASGDCSLYDKPNCSSRSSLSNSFDSLANLEMRRSKLDLEKNIDSFLKESTKKKELDNVEKTGSFSSEPLIGLKLGKRTYFEDLSASNNLKSSSNSSNSSTLIKKSRLSCLSIQTPQCQVEECTADLSVVKEYYRRHRVCEKHSKSQNVIVYGHEQRFCQQCSRFHELSEFDDKKRSCRRRLSDHNARRRKPQPNLGHQMNFGSNPVSPVPSFTLSNFRRKDSSNFKLSQDKGAFLMCIKEGFINEKSCSPSLDATNSISTPHFDRIFPLKGAIGEILHPDVENMPCTSIPDVTPELHSALSLLSADIWCTNPTSLHKFPAFSGLPPTHEAQHAFPLTTSGYWHPEHHIKSESVFEFQQRHQGLHHPHSQAHDFNC